MCMARQWQLHRRVLSTMYCSQQLSSWQSLGIYCSQLLTSTEGWTNIIKNIHELVSSDSLQRIKGDSTVCHWTSESEAKLVLGFKVTTQYLEREMFIQPSLQWLKLWSWTESQSWAVIQIQFGKWNDAWQTDELIWIWKFSLLNQDGRSSFNTRKESVKDSYII